METRSKRLKEQDEMDGKYSKAVCGMSDVNDDKLDDISVNSKSSSQFSTSRFKLDKALIKKKNLEKRLELEKQLKMLELQEEVDMAELECKLIENDNQLSVDKAEINSKVERYLDCDIERNKVINASKCGCIDELKDTLRATVNNTVLPKIDMMFFDGQPSQYHRFISQFTSIIESKLSDKGQLLSYLSYYCKGKAKNAIEGCIIMDPQAGYKRAKAILKQLFGQSHVIARETLEDLFRTGNVDFNDSELLTNLAIKMQNAALTLEQLNCTTELNSMVTLERIVRLLPRRMQAQ
ncbi:unnamed protein product [Schistosoma turkestanicum]|nr:unnamed protein product [Schistosoma turkestanicum]